MSISVTDWTETPVMIPRTLFIDQHLTPVEKAVGAYALTVDSNIAYGGETYNWLNAVDAAKVLGVSEDAVLLAMEKLHKLGYVSFYGMPEPSKPTHRERREMQLRNLSPKKSDDGEVADSGWFK